MWDQSDNATNALDMDISKPRVKVRKDASFAEKKHTDDVKKRRSVETATRTTDPHSKGCVVFEKNKNIQRKLRQSSKDIRRKRIRRGKIQQI